MLVNMVLTFSIFAFFIFHGVIADLPPFESQYRVLPNGHAGSCIPQWPLLEASYSESIAMLQAGIDAIDMVQENRIFNWVKGSKQNRASLVLQALFQVKTASIFKSMDRNDLANLIEIRRKSYSKANTRLI